MNDEKKLRFCEKCYLSLQFNNCPTKVAYKIPGREIGEMPSVIFIGDKPSSVDVRLKTPFSGRNNNIISKYINDYFLTKYSHQTNLIKCSCIEPSDEYANNCVNILIRELQILKPRIIVPIGTYVYQYLTDNKNKSMKRVVNKPTAFANSIMIPIYSPSYIKKEDLYQEYDKSFDIISDIFSKLCKEYKTYK